MRRIVIVLLCMVFCGYADTYAQKRNLRVAHRAIEKGRIMKAKRRIDRATAHRKTADAPHAWLLRAKIYSRIALNTQQYPGVDSAALQAARAFEKTLTLVPENDLLSLQARQGWENLYNQVVQQAITHADSARFDNAWQLLDKARRVLPEEPDAYLLEGHLAFARREYDKAEQNYQHLLQKLAYKGGGLSEVWTNMITLQLLQHTSVDSALYYVRQAQSYLPDSLQFFRQEIVLLMQAGRLSEAEQRLQTEVFPIAIQPELTAVLARQYLDNNKPEKAIGLLKNVYPDHPENHRILLSLARSHQHMASELKNGQPSPADPEFITHKRKAEEYLMQARQHLPQDDAAARKDIRALTSSLNALDETQSP